MAQHAGSKNVQRIKYVHIDVVEFTREDRSVEDWLDIIASMNRIVLDAIKELGLDRKHLVLLPTGDGLFICILSSKRHDVHLKLAVQIHARVDLHNASTDDVMARFLLRIAVNEHYDLVIKDINQKSNVVGLGINTTARIIAGCPPAGIVVGESVYNDTRKFKEFSGRYAKVPVTDKHGKEHLAYLLALEPDKDASLISLIGKVKGRIGPELTMADINALKVGSLVYHKVDHLGQVIEVGPPAQAGQKRRITIRFKDNEHTIDMNNVSKNYCRWLV
jgi:class 3 adenylate cyclase